jgi:pyruvate/2-oxoglutarate dehydrogenase complex dihydrolipoamide acyltransferase (E2) component
MVAAAVRVSHEYGTIHAITEVDITIPRRILSSLSKQIGEKLSFTAFIVASLVRTLKDYPEFNSFRKGRKLILLDDVTVSVLVERAIGDEVLPEPLVIQAAQSKTYRQVHDEIRMAQQKSGDEFGTLSGMMWIRYIPEFLLRIFVRLAARNIYMAKRYGKVGVTAVGMFGKGGVWFVPVSSGTVVATVGGIVEKPIRRGRRVVVRELLCLTLSFNHEIVDGAPAARFVKALAEHIERGEVLSKSVGAAKIPSMRRNKSLKEPSTLVAAQPITRATTALDK